MTVSIDRALTTGEKNFLDQFKMVIPSGFLESCPDGTMRDLKLLGIAALALSDYNNMPPAESYNFNSLPPILHNVIIMGGLQYVAMLKQMEFSLVDISYSDNGLSITLDRVGKIGASMDNLEKQWLRILQNAKNIAVLKVGGVGLGTPRFQSSMSKMISILGQGAAGWNVP